VDCAIAPVAHIANAPHIAAAAIFMTISCLGYVGRCHLAMLNALPV
jgi:hypothetical protein